jgi:hypothetical protein
MSNNVSLSYETSETMKILGFLGGKSDIHLPRFPSFFEASPAGHLPSSEIQTIIH